MFVESYILKKRQLGIHDGVSTLLIAVELLVPGFRNNLVTVQAPDPAAKKDLCSLTHHFVLILLHISSKHYLYRWHQVYDIYSHLAMMLSTNPIEKRKKMKLCK